MAAPKSVRVLDVAILDLKVLQDPLDWHLGKQVGGVTADSVVPIGVGYLFSSDSHSENSRDEAVDYLYLLVVWLTQLVQNHTRRLCSASASSLIIFLVSFPPFLVGN